MIIDLNKEILQWISTEFWHLVSAVGTRCFEANYFDPFLLRYPSHSEVSVLTSPCSGIWYKIHLLSWRWSKNGVVLAPLRTTCYYSLTIFPNPNKSKITTFLNNTPQSVLLYHLVCTESCASDWIWWRMMVQMLWRIILHFNDFKIDIWLLGFLNVCNVLLKSRKKSIVNYARNLWFLWVKFCKI